MLNQHPQPHICFSSLLTSPRNPMKKSTSLLLLASAAILAFAAPTQAQLIAYENFNTTAGTNSISGSSGTGSSGFSNNWTTIGEATGGNIINPGYTYTDLATAGNRAQIFNADASATYFYRSLSSPFTVGANSTGTLWASFLIQATAAASGQGASIGFFDVSIPTATTTTGVTIGAIGSNANYRVANRPLDVSSGGGIVVTTSTSAATYALAVFKFTIDTNAGGNETFSLWLNPTLSSFDGSEGSLGTAALSNQSLGNMGISSISSVAFGSNYVSQGSATLGLDEIRLGTSLSSVLPVPEPSTWALLTIGLTALMVFRRRSRQA